MFTGIVQHIGTVADITEQPAGVRLGIARTGWRPTAEPGLGDSVCVSGVCLTVTQRDGDEVLWFDVIGETLDKTTLGDLVAGAPVNLEPAVTPTQPMGGHFMQGHVDGVGEVVAVSDDPGDWRLTIHTPGSILDAVISKGSIAVEGVSLTIADVDDDTFTVALIPTTLEQTTLDALRIRSRVNLEADILAKTVVATLRRMLPAEDGCKASGGTLSLGLLRGAGFLE